jgi:ABC-2 type transport system ATP-binding protein
MSPATQTAPALTHADAAAIAVRGLVKRYPKAETNAVDGVSFEVPHGEIFGLLGPNGAGKTTTIGVLTTAIIPTAGSVAVAGIDVVRDPIGVKQRIAVVAQHSNLDRRLNARDILTFHASYHGVPRKEREQRADRLLEELGLGSRKREKVNRYSGGLTQRLMIARALMHSPEVLFLDEPTNNLDPQSRLFLWQRINELNAAGLTILLTTHDMQEAERLCHRIAIMDHGRILINDTPAGLKKSIPGGTSLRVRVWAPGPDYASMHECVRLALRCLPGVTKVETVDENSDPTGEAVADPAFLTCRLYSGGAAMLIGPAAQAVLSAGAEIRDLNLKQPSLEEVFIYLTGRELR